MQLKYVRYGYRGSCYLYAMFWHISSISMQCPYFSYTIAFCTASYVNYKYFLYRNHA